MTLRPVLPEVEPWRQYRWAIAVGAWGDVFAACGNALEVLRRTGQEQIGVVYYGMHPQACQFLEAQPWCREVVRIAPADEEEYHPTARRSGERAARREEWLAPLLSGIGVDPEEVALTHLDHRLLVDPQVHRWGPARLPETARRWADQVLQRLPDAPVLLQPFSLWSNPWENHWPHWTAAIEWLLQTTPYQYLLVGHGWNAAELLDRIPAAARARVTDLVGRTPSMLEVLALAERSRLLVTTSNCLSMWSVMQGVPAVVPLNCGIEGYFYHWINAAPNRLVPFDMPLPLFQVAFEEAERGGSEQGDLIAGRQCPLCAGLGKPVGVKEGHLLRECICHGRILLSWAWKSAEEYRNWYLAEDAPYHGPHQETQGLRPMWERDGEYLNAASVRLRILRGLFPQARRVLDVGAGTGAFVSQLQAHGYDVVGFEPCPVMVEQARTRGRNLVLGGWEEIPEGESADLVTLHDVLEHLPEPVRCLKRLRELIGREGALCVEMPEWGCRKAQVEWMGFRHVRPLEHLALYDEKAAVELFHRADLKVAALIRPLDGLLGKVTFYLKAW